MAQPVVVTKTNNIPVVEFNDHRALGKGAALASEIMDQVRLGDLLETPTEQLARMLGAAAFQHEYGINHTAEMDAIRDLVAVAEDAEPTDVFERIGVVGNAVRENAAQKQLPVIGANTSSGVDMAVNGANVITSGATGSGDDWKPGEGWNAFVQEITSTYPDTTHPIRRMLSTLQARISA